MREYDVRMGDKVVGTAVVEREGLYYRIRLRCDLDSEIMHKIMVRSDVQEENLGVAVPMEGMFGVDTSVQIKKLGDGELRFVVLPRHRELQGRFIPLSPEEPFQYISRLKNAFLDHHAGRVGVVIKEPGCG